MVVAVLDDWVWTVGKQVKKNIDIMSCELNARLQREENQKYAFGGWI